jgi:SAM-dependent methyltransferase
MRLQRKLGTLRDIYRSQGVGAVIRHTIGKVSVLFIEKPDAGSSRWLESKKAVDDRFDQRYNVDTGGVTHLHDLKIVGPNRRFGTTHIASDPAEFTAAVSSLSIRHADYTFIDLGCGKGRALMMASSYSFRRIIGVEFALELYMAAQENLRRAAAAGVDIIRIELLHADATHFEFPLEPLVLFLYNPFDGDVMQTMVHRIRQTHLRNPRPVFVLYTNPLLYKHWIDAGFLTLQRGDSFVLLAPPA